MNINLPQESQIPQLRLLWKEAFQDTDTFLDSFFKTAFCPNRCLCITDKEKIIAALYWFDCEYNKKPIAYLYGVAVAKAYRQKGIGHNLMTETHKYLSKRGYEAVILVPSCDKLFHFYKKIGYQHGTDIREFTCMAKPEEVKLCQIEKEEYARLRRLLLPKGSVLQEKENLHFLQTQVNFYMGSGFLLAAHIEKNTLYGVELLGDTSLAPAIVYTLNCEKGTFRTHGHERPFSMYYALTDTPLPMPYYFGFAFD